MGTTRIIGLNGYARSGKDAAASALVADGWERIAFADALRDIAYAIDPYVELSGDIEGYPWYDNTNYYRLSTVIGWLGWEQAKAEHPDVRRLLQRLGTEGGRDILGKNIWVDTAFKRARMDGAGLVITDVRFQNEAEAIRERGGKVVRLNRPGIGPVNEHSSDNAMEGFIFDAYIYNGGPLSELYDSIRKIANG